MKKQIYLIGTSVCFFYYDSTALPIPTTAFFRSVPSALLTIDVSPTGDIQFSQKDNNGGLPSPFLSAPLADIVDAVGANYASIATLIAAITPAAGGGGGTVTAPDIANYSIGVDTTANNAWVRILTVFDPVTNVPARSFFQLNGVTAYTPSTTAAAIIDAEGLLKDVYTATYSSLIYTEAIERRLGNIMTATRIIDQAPSSDAQPRMTLTQKIINPGSGGGDISSFTTADAQQVQIIALTGTFLMRDAASGFITYPIQTAGGGTIADFKLEAAFGKTLPSIEYIITDGSSVLVIESISYM